MSTTFDVSKLPPGYITVSIKAIQIELKSVFSPDKAVTIFEIASAGKVEASHECHLCVYPTLQLMQAKVLSIKF